MFLFHMHKNIILCEPASVAQLQASPTDDRGFWVRPPPSRQDSSVEIDHEIFSTAILSLPDLLLTYSTSRIKGITEKESVMDVL